MQKFILSIAILVCIVSVVSSYAARDPGPSTPGSSEIEVNNKKEGSRRQDAKLPVQTFSKRRNHTKKVSGHRTGTIIHPIIEPAGNQTGKSSKKSNCRTNCGNRGTKKQARHGTRKMKQLDFNQDDPTRVYDQDPYENDSDNDNEYEEDDQYAQDEPSFRFSREKRSLLGELFGYPSGHYRRRWWPSGGYGGGGRGYGGWRHRHHHHRW